MTQRHVQVWHIYCRDRSRIKWLQRNPYTGRTFKLSKRDGPFELLLTQIIILYYNVIGTVAVLPPAMQKSSTFNGCIRKGIKTDRSLYRL